VRRLVRARKTGISANKIVDHWTHIHRSHGRPLPSPGRSPNTGHLIRTKVQNRMAHCAERTAGPALRRRGDAVRAGSRGLRIGYLRDMILERQLGLGLGRVW
jgi:hypothetical protein